MYIGGNGTEFSIFKKPSVYNTCMMIVKNYVFIFWTNTFSRMGLSHLLNFFFSEF